MKQVLQILSAVNKSGIGSKSQKAYSMNICQCVVTDSETGEIQVGELTMPKDSALPLPGIYEAEFKIGVDYATKKIGGVLVAIVPLEFKTVQGELVPLSDKSQSLASGKQPANAPPLAAGAVSK